LSFDISASLRRLKPQKKTGARGCRDDAELSFVDQACMAGPPVLIDTTVYIDALQDRLPDAVARLLRVRQLNHSAVAVAELTHLFGRLDPAHPKTADICRVVQTTIANIPAHRLRAPSVSAMAEAGILTGVHARLQRLPRQDMRALLNDAQMFLQAIEQGCHLLTRNIGDMDRLQQILPAGRMLFYRRKP
jgi:hypothetical protein